MSRLFSCAVSEARLLGHALYPWRDLLNVPETESPYGWGIGYHQNQNVLIKRRPNFRGALDFYGVMEDLAADRMVAHVRKHTVGRASPENTHPFRFRQWIFAHHGTISRFDNIRPWLVNSIPSFLKRSMRGDTDSEHLFYLFLAFLYDDGLLEDHNLPAERAAQALRNTFHMVERFVRDAGGQPSGLNVATTNGSIMLFSSVNRPGYYTRFEGLFDCDLCRQLPEHWDEEPKRKDHPHLKGVLCFSDPEPQHVQGLRHMPLGSVLAVDPDMTVSVLSLDLET
jgi:glutamine amidotransferase